MLGHTIVSQHFMEPEGSIPNSQELSTCSYPEPDQGLLLREDNSDRLLRKAEFRSVLLIVAVTAPAISYIIFLPMGCDGRFHELRL
jgi:hypothetical protein